MQVEALYQDIILDHYKNPHGKGLREPFEAEVYHVNPTCGDEVTLRVHLEGEGADARVADVSYDSMGCSISQASASVMYDLVHGKTVKEALRLHDEFLTLMQSKGQLEPDEDVLEDGIAFAGVSKYPARIKCALLSWMAWKDATAKAQVDRPDGAGTLDVSGATTAAGADDHHTGDHPGDHTGDEDNDEKGAGR